MLPKFVASYLDGSSQKVTCYLYTLVSVSFPNCRVVHLHLSLNHAFRAPKPRTLSACRARWAPVLCELVSQNNSRKGGSNESRRNRSCVGSLHQCSYVLLGCFSSLPSRSIADKEQWEPCIERLFELVETRSGPSISTIWALDCTNHGDSAVLNESLLSPKQPLST